MVTIALICLPASAEEWRQRAHEREHQDYSCNWRQIGPGSYQYPIDHRDPYDPDYRRCRR
jgi:hypothetical protein